MQRHSSRALTALLVAIISIPLSAQAVSRGQSLAALTGLSETTVRTQAMEHHLVRRAYSKAMADYRLRVKNGEKDAVKPNINDPKTFAIFLNEEELSDAGRRARNVVRRSTSSASSVRTKPADIDAENLTTRQRMLLRTYMRSGSCPESMDTVLPGLMQLCRNIVGEKASEDHPSGFDNDLKAVRASNSAGPATLRLRLKMLEQALDRENRRADGTGPMRPTPYTGE